MAHGAWSTEVRATRLGVRSRSGAALGALLVLVTAVGSTSCRRWPHHSHHSHHSDRAHRAHRAHGATSKTAATSKVLVGASLAGARSPSGEMQGDGTSRSGQTDDDGGSERPVFPANPSPSLDGRARKQPVASLCRKDERSALTFVTRAAKTMSLCVGLDDAWLTYRFGTPEHIELEFPKERDASSWRHFKYEWWMRPGGVDNWGMDMNHLSFENDGFEYTIYHDWTAEGSTWSVGVAVAPVGTERELRIDARRDSVVGNLLDFRFAWRHRVRQAD